MKKPDDPATKKPPLEKPQRLNSRAIQASPTMHAQRSKLEKAFGSGNAVGGAAEDHRHGTQHRQQKSNYLQAWRIDEELNELIARTRVEMQAGMQLTGTARTRYFIDLAAAFEKECQVLCQNDESGRRGSHDVAVLLRELAKSRQPERKALQVEQVIDAMKRRITLGK